METLRPVYVFPDYSGDNRYQTMLHSRLETIGAYAEPVGDVTAHLRARSEMDEPGVTHVHWTAPILQNSAGPFSAKLRLDAFTASLRMFKEAGGRLVWTIHNVLPHDGRHRWAEIELATTLADQADAIHVISEATFDAVGDLYPVDRSKVAVIGISSYLGEYPDWVSREGARKRLGIMPEEKVLIALGGIRPYKGLDLLVDIFEPLARRDPSLRLLIAGRAGNLPGIPELRHRCAKSPRIISEFQHLPDDQLQVWMRAADLAVLPYRAVLNSSAFKLAESFGLPVLGPRVGALVDEEDQAHVRLFDPTDESSLNLELQAAISELVAEPEGAAAARASSRAAAARFTSSDMGDQYAAFMAPFMRAGSARQSE
jgi:glycosyltransferase involved in cell wall biosynthesis